MKRRFGQFGAIALFSVVVISGCSTAESGKSGEISNPSASGGSSSAQPTSGAPVVREKEKSTVRPDLASGGTKIPLSGPTSSENSAAAEQDFRDFAIPDSVFNLLKIKRLEIQKRALANAAVPPPFPLRSGLSVAGTNYPSLQDYRLLTGHTNWILSLVFSPDSSVLASGSSDKSIRLWRTATGQEIPCTLGHAGSVTSLAFSPDGKFMASGSSDNAIRIWNFAGLKELRKIETHMAAVTSLSYSPDGGRLAAGTTVGRVFVWDPLAGKELQELERHSGGVNSVAYSPDGKHFASAGADGCVLLYDLAPGGKTRKLSAHIGSVLAVAFSGDGQSLASGGTDKATIVWDVSTGWELRKLVGSGAAVRALAFSPDSRSLASAGEDEWMTIWDTKTEFQQRMYSADTYGANAIAFSPDGMHIVSGGLDKNVRLRSLGAGLAIKHSRTQSTLAYMGFCGNMIFGKSAVGSVLALSADGRDMSEGTRQGPPHPVSILKPAGPPEERAGEPIRLKLGVDNSGGKGSLFQVAAVTECGEEAALDNLVFLIGMVEAGKSVETEIAIPTDRRWNDRRVAVKFRFVEQTGFVPRDAVQSIDIKGNPQPAFDLSFEVREDIGNGDGVLQAGETARLALKIRNSGNESAKDVRISAVPAPQFYNMVELFGAANSKFPEIKPGDEVNSEISVSLKGNSDDASIVMKVVVIESGFDKILTQEILLKIGK